MLLETLKPGTLPGANGDDQYLALVQRYGDTTDVGAQLQALAHYGVTARLVQVADFRLIEQQIARGIPVPCDYIHLGPVERPTGSGHWLLVVGHTPTHLVVNDPGESRIWSAVPPSTPTGWGCASRGGTLVGGGWWRPSVVGPTAMRRAGGGRCWWVRFGEACWVWLAQRAQPFWNRLNRVVKTL